jgi:phospho-N-acetylmuramoyl-pentapeptide-transferase
LLYYLLQPFARDVRIFNLLNYITFRSAAAFVTALLMSFVFGPIIIRRLRAMSVHQVVREGTPDSHASKGQTPTMGGLIILVASILPVAIWARLDNRYVLLAVMVMMWMGGIGFLDDYLKLRQKRAGLKNEGLVERYKLAGQVTCGIGLGLWLWLSPLSDIAWCIVDAAVLQVCAARAGIGRAGVAVRGVGDIHPHGFQQRRESH